MTSRPASVEQWRQTTALFGAADWDTGVLAQAAVVDANDDGDAAAAVAGDMAAAVRLGVAGVVAARAGQLFEVEETVDGWTLEPSSGTPDVADLAMAAAIRATQVAAQRRQQEWR